MNEGFHRVLSLNIPDVGTLHEAYMSFVDGGGLFVPTDEDFSLGDEVHLSLSLPGEEDQQMITGKVVWLTPRGAQSGGPAGAGMQFTEESAALSALIEELLVGLIDSDRPTHTL